jgi:predicted aspartyl protease
MMESRLAFGAVLLGFGVLALTRAHADPTCPAGVSATNILLLESAQIAVPVEINGTGPFKFVLDTGSQLTVLEPSLAEQLELPGVGAVAIVSLAGRSTATLAGVESLGVGINEIRKPRVAVLDLGAIQRVNPEVRGILGQDFLAHFDLLIDPQHMLLCFDQTGRMQHKLNGEHIPVLRSSAVPTPNSFTEPVLIAAHLEGGGSDPAVLKLDCGGNVPLLFQSAVLLEGKQHGHGRSGQIREGSALGRRTTLSFRAMSPRNVVIGTRRLRGIKFFSPASEGTAHRTGEDGLLPITLFKRVFISNRDRYVIFDPH